MCCFWSEHSVLLTVLFGGGYFTGLVKYVKNSLKLICWFSLGNFTITVIVDTSERFFCCLVKCHNYPSVCSCHICVHLGATERDRDLDWFLFDTIRRWWELKLEWNVTLCTKLSWKQQQLIVWGFVTGNTQTIYMIPENRVKEKNKYKLISIRAGPKTPTRWPPRHLHFKN